MLPTLPWYCERLKLKSMRPVCSTLVKRPTASEAIRAASMLDEIEPLLRPKECMECKYGKRLASANAARRKSNEH